MFLCKISRFTFFSSYLCTQNIIVMVDKRTLEFILTDQQEEMEGRAEEALCQRREESLIDFKSTHQRFAIRLCTITA